NQGCGDGRRPPGSDRHSHPRRQLRRWQPVPRVSLPAGQHRREVVPPVEDNHDQVAGDERQKSAHRREVPYPRQMESAHDPSHPPKVRAFGTSTRFFWGSLGPKLGKARKIRSPLVTRTKTETAFNQWQKRTTQGCSNAARTLSLGFSVRTAGTSTAWSGPGGS